MSNTTTSSETPSKKPVPTQQDLSNLPKKPVNPLDVYNDVANQMVMEPVVQKGFYITGGTDTFQDKDTNKDVKYYFAQMLIRPDPNSTKMELMNIKAKEDQLGLLDILNKSCSFQFISLNLDLHKYGKSLNLYLSNEQPALKLSS